MINKAIVLGDLILDEYVSGDVSRISPEAPVPVIDKKKHFYRIGGAGNVALCLSSMVNNSKYIIASSDQRISDLFSSHSRNLEIFSVKSGSEYSIKQRVMAGHHPFVRVDSDIELRIPSNFYDTVLNNTISSGDVILLSDYGKGACQHSRYLINYLKNLGAIVAVDPKSKNWSNYYGAHCVKCNELEFKSHRIYDKKNPSLDSDSLQETMKTYDIQTLIVTRGAEGIVSMSKDLSLNSHSASLISVYDVSGAGDSVFAGVGYLLKENLSISRNLAFLNELGSMCVQQIGTSHITPRQFENALKQINV